MGFRARFTGRQRHLFTIPERFDINSKSDLVINSVIAWSFYPKLLTREGESWRNVANKQTANLYPTSVNRQSSSPPKWLSFYNMMQAHSKAYNAHETSAVEDFAVALLCGDPEFKVRTYEAHPAANGNALLIFTSYIQASFPWMVIELGSQPRIGKKCLPSKHSA